MYIKSVKAISAQASYDNRFFTEEVKTFDDLRYEAQEPSYKGMIKPSMLRRMGKSVRIGIGAGMPLLNDNNDVDGIIIGSSEGGLEDCIKFLNQIVQYEEGALTPTNFVQSTPNALSGSLALMTKSTGYNITHVHKGAAFENAFLDALMLLKEQKAKKLLVGNVEEISEYNFNIETLAGQFKKEKLSSETLLQSNTEGTVCGEGSAMFIVSSNSDDSLAQVLDIDQITKPEKEELYAVLADMLKRNGISVADIDAVYLGNNGDCRSDFWYEDLKNDFFSENQSIYTYKNIAGEYPTCSAFATYLATHLLNGQQMPESIIQKRTAVEAKTVLIYNHYKAEQHSFILMKSSC